MASNCSTVISRVDYHRSHVSTPKRQSGAAKRDKTDINSYKMAQNDPIYAGIDSSLSQVISYLSLIRRFLIPFR